MSSRSGFTLLEILIVLAIVGIVAGAARLLIVPQAGIYQQDLNSATIQVVSDLREAQSNAMAQDRDVNWGVYFSNVTSTAPFYALYYTSYSTSTMVNYLRLPASLAYATSFLALGATTSINFNIISGFPTASATIVIYARNQPNLSSTIYVNTTGCINCGAGLATPSAPHVTYVIESVNERIQDFSSTGTYIGQIGCATGGCAASSTGGHFNSPEDLAFDGSGSMYIVDQTNERVQKLSPTGTYLYQLGICSSGACSVSGLNGGLNAPVSVAVNASNTVFVTDDNGNRVEEYSATGTYVTQIGCASLACTASAATGSFHGPAGLRFNSGGQLYVADTSNYRVQEFSPTGTYIGEICSPGTCTFSSATGGFEDPYLLSFDPSGDVYVADVIANRVEEFSPTGTYMMQLGCTAGACAATSSNGGFNNDYGVGADFSGNTYVADNINNRIQEFSPTGTYLGKFGCGSGACPNSSSNGFFYSPLNVVVY